MSAGEKFHIFLAVVVVVLIMIVMALSYEIRLCQKTCTSSFSAVRDTFRSPGWSEIKRVLMPARNAGPSPARGEGFAACPTCH